MDHFFPHTLFDAGVTFNLNGIWNLVLACQVCNRGNFGKFARVPKLKYLERLHKRNNFLVESHHPLRETIMQQTGYTEKERQEFLQAMDVMSIGTLIHRWGPVNEREAAF